MLRRLNFKEHFSRTYYLAYPVMLSQLGQVMVGVADSVMVGRLGAVPLAAASLANSIFFVIMMFGTGVSMAITPLVAAADGEGKPRMITRIFNHGFAINGFTGIFLFLVIVMAAPLLYHMEQPEEVVELGIPFLGIISMSLIPLMFFQTFRQFAEGLSQTKQAMMITVFCNLINVGLNWLLIYGNLGFPAMGLNGAGWATLISRVLMLLIMWYFVWNSKRFKAYHIKFNFRKLYFPMFSKMLKLGLPTGFQFVFEVGAFSTAAIMMGWIGVNALASHQIAINLASISYMMASGLSAAATVRVGNQLGRKDIKTLREAGFTIFGMVVIFMSVFAIFFISMRNYLPLLYIDDVQVVEVTASLLIIAGLFQLSDGIQVVGLGALRGMADVKVPTIFTLIAYWVIALPLGYLLAFHWGLAERGVWFGLLIGLTITGTLLLTRFNKLSLRLLHRQKKTVQKV